MNFYIELLYSETAASLNIKTIFRFDHEYDFLI